MRNDQLPMTNDQSAGLGHRVHHNGHCALGIHWSLRIGNWSFQKAFTLIELLIVIAIIGVLAGMLATSLASAQRKTKIRLAKAQMNELAAVIQAYESEYGRMPCSKDVLTSLTAGSPDFTFGTAGLSISPNIISTANGGYQANNAEIIAVLRPSGNPSFTTLFNTLNPRRVALFNAKDAIAPNGPGVGADGVLRDPFGNPYIITLDLNDDNICQDGFYYPLTQRTEGTGLLIPGQVMIWSFGPDGKANDSVARKAGENKDNILSWE